MRVRQFTCYALAMLGRFAELARRLPGYERDAEAHGDLYGALNLRVGLPHTTWLVRGDVERARAALAHGERWQADAFTLEHYYTMYAGAQLHLYRGDGAAAYRHFAASWRALTRSFLLRIQTIRFNAWYLRGRVALAGAVAEPNGRAARRAEARGVARKLTRAKGTWGAPLGTLLEAGVAALDGGDPSPLLLAALPGLDAAGLRLHAATARWYLRGRDAAHGEAAERYFREEEAAEPERVAAMTLPALALRAGS